MSEVVENGTDGDSGGEWQSGSECGVESWVA